jgi:hypothetical protein
VIRLGLVWSFYCPHPSSIVHHPIWSVNKSDYAGRSVWVEVEEVLPVPITLNVYQNLNQGTVQFEYLGDLKPPLQIAVYNLAGQRVQSFLLSESSSVTFNNLAAGMYLIDARLEGIPVKTAKVVVGR